MNRPLAFALLILAGCAHQASMTQPSSSTPPTDAAAILSASPQELAAFCQRAIDTAHAKVKALSTLDAKKDPDAVLAAYDQATAALDNAASVAGLSHEVSPDAKLRDAGRDCEQKLEEVSVELSQDRGVYDRLSAVDLSQKDAATKLWMQRTLLDFRRAGVDRDDATRAKVKALNDELVKLGQAFNQNIAEDVRKVSFSPDELDGLPKDFLDGHKPDKDGKVVLTTNYPDYFPVMTYAKSAKTREALWRAYHQRAYPQNLAILDQLISKRYELATLLGYPNWAAYTFETKMTKTEKTVSDFVDKVSAAALPRAKQEYELLLSRKKKDAPGATALDPWDNDYYEDRVKAEQLGFDSQSLRPYFEYSRVKAGVLQVTSQMFGVRFVPAKDAKVWHPSVDAYDVFEGEQKLGRIYLDMHPRDDKYKHAAQFDIAFGQKGVRLPEGALVTNFPPEGQLMTADEVETFFHEFGHLLHSVFAGHQAWEGISGIKTEWDFVETPSMLLQEWASEPTVLATFARHFQTGEVIPAALVGKLKATHEFGKGLWTRRQMFLSAVALTYFNQKPGFDTTSQLAEIQDKYKPFREEWRPGTYFQLAFGHLEGYSAAYYTYLWSVVIAKDLQTEFEKHGYLDAGTALKYRKAVLDPGGSKPAAELVSDFLGRPYSFDAYKAYMDRD